MMIHIKRIVKKVVKPFFPPNSFRRKALKKAVRALRISRTVEATYYNTWMYQHSELPAFELWNGKNIKGPLISIVVPVFNTPRHHLLELVYSVVSQAYENWELILVDASNKKKVSENVQDCTSIDTRIRVIKTENGGISSNTNKGIENSNGEYIAFSDHDDTLDPFALHYVAQAILSHGAEVIYSDEDKISEDGQKYFDPHFKPDWSPDLLTHVNYINHLTVIKRTLLDKVGLLDPKKDGAQDYDLMLRVTDTNPIIYHIPKVLYHWRAARSSTAQDFSTKRNITDAGAAAISEHFQRINIEAKVKPKADRPGFYEAILPSSSAVTLIIPPFASDALLRFYVELLLAQTKLKQTRLQLIVPRGVEPKKSLNNASLSVLPADENYMRNALRIADNEEVVIIGRPLLPMSRSWLNNMTGMLRLKHIRAVSPLITHGRVVIEDAGLVRDATGTLAPLFKNEACANRQTFLGNIDWVRNVDALSGGFMLARKSDLSRFMETITSPFDFVSLIRRFTEAENLQGGAYNVISPEVRFDNAGIRLRPNASPSNPRTFFNPNLCVTGVSYELYTPETAAINILRHEIERLEDETN